MQGTLEKIGLSKDEIQVYSNIGLTPLLKIQKNPNLRMPQKKGNQLQIE